jgi:hypothetical protein
MSGMRTILLVTALTITGCAEGTEQCETCAEGVPITLAWDANAPEDMVVGYRVYLGPSEDATTMVMVDDVAVTTLEDAANPTVTYDAWLDFMLSYGDQACFRLTAYNTAGESGFSNAACKTVAGDSMDFGL